MFYFYADRFSFVPLYYIRNERENFAVLRNGKETTSFVNSFFQWKISFFKFLSFLAFFSCKRAVFILIY